MLIYFMELDQMKAKLSLDTDYFAFRILARLVDNHSDFTNIIKALVPTMQYHKTSISMKIKTFKSRRFVSSLCIS